MGCVFLALLIACCLSAPWPHLPVTTGSMLHDPTYIDCIGGYKSTR
ncbi:MAG: hypothetical protein ACLS3F_12095 [Oscillospiraceae bacterium]